MKKFVAALTALCLCAALPAAVLAAEPSQAQTADTRISFELKNDPTYTVNIPVSASVSREGTEVKLSAENVANLENQKISVRIAGTDYFRNQLVLTQDDTGAVMRYQIETASGELIETVGTDTATGREIAAFSENGEASYRILPVIAPSTRAGSYSGTLTYSIGLETVEAAS